jgi:hypothetical protein
LGLVTALLASRHNNPPIVDADNAKVTLQKPADEMEADETGSTDYECDAHQSIPKRL